MPGKKCDIVGFVAVPQSLFADWFVKLPINDAVFLELQHRICGPIPEIGSSFSRHSVEKQYSTNRNGYQKYENSGLHIKRYSNKQLKEFQKDVPSQKAQSYFMQVTKQHNTNRAFIGFTEGRPVTMCYALKSLNNLQPSFEICALFTAEEKRGKGFARCIASAATDYALEADSIVYYIVDDENAPSKSVAEAVGYSCDITAFRHVGEKLQTAVQHK